MDAEASGHPIDAAEARLSRKRLTDGDIDDVSRGLATIKAHTCATHIVARTSVGRNDAVEVVERVDVFEAYGSMTIRVRL